jgi:hypothetical protein
VQLALNPVTTSVVILLVTNAIMLGFGLWWQAESLQLMSYINLGCLALALVNQNCLKIDPILTTICWAGPVATGFIAVRAYRCMRTLEDSSFVSDCPDVDVGSFAWTVELPFYLEWIRGAFQWFVDFVNRIPEGLSWLNMAGGTVFLIVSVFYWDWCSGGDSDDKGERPPADPGISKEEARMLVALARQSGQAKPTSGIAAAITQFRMRGERKFRNQTLADLPIRWNRFKAKLQGVSRGAHAERKHTGGVSIRAVHMATTLPLIAPNRP